MAWRPRFLNRIVAYALSPGTLQCVRSARWHPEPKLLPNITARHYSQHYEHINYLACRLSPTELLQTVDLGLSQKKRTTPPLKRKETPNTTERYFEAEGHAKSTIKLLHRLQSFRFITKDYHPATTLIFGTHSTLSARFLTTPGRFRARTAVAARRVFHRWRRKTDSIPQCTAN